MVGYECQRAPFRVRSLICAHQHQLLSTGIQMRLRPIVSDESTLLYTCSGNPFLLEAQLLGRERNKDTHCLLQAGGPEPQDWASLHRGALSNRFVYFRLLSYVECFAGMDIRSAVFSRVRV